MRSPSLAELQRLFWHALARAPGAGLGASPLGAVLEPGPRLGVAERFQVYADAYLWRLRDCLREDFPRVAARLGAEAFEGLVRDYLRAHPSEHPSVRHVGRHFVGFVEGRADVPPWLADLARLEWARVEAFDAPDATPIGVEDLRRVAPEAFPGLRFVPVPSLDVVACAWPAHEPWREDAAVPAAPAATVLRVWRGAEWRVFHAPMETREASALARLRRGEPFAVLCEAFADLADDEAPRVATAVLLRWLEDGLIAATR
jgi:hypothetical protein